MLGEIREYFMGAEDQQDELEMTEPCIPPPRRECANALTNTTCCTFFGASAGLDACLQAVGETDSPPPAASDRCGR